MEEVRPIDANDLKKRIEYYAYCIDNPSSLALDMTRRARETLMEMIDEASTVNVTETRRTAHVVWKEQPKRIVLYDQIPVSEYFKNGKLAYTRRTIKKENDRDPFCSECGGKLFDNVGRFCPWCGAVIVDGLGWRLEL